MDGIQSLIPPAGPMADPMAGQPPMMSPAMGPDDPMTSLAGLLQSLSPSDVAALRMVQEELLQMDDEELADLSDLLDFVESNPDQMGEVVEMIGADVLPMEAAPSFVKLLNGLVKTIVAPAGMVGMPDAPQGFAMGPPAGMVGTPEAPQNFAMGGPAFGNLMSKGRGGDTMLAHITPGEAHMLRARGGSGTINPATGLPEFFVRGLSRAVRSAGRAVRRVAPVLLPVAINTVAPGLGMIASGALGAGLGTVIQGGSVRDALRNAAVGGAAGAAISGVQGMMSGEGFMAGVRGGLPQGMRPAQQALKEAAQPPSAATAPPADGVGPYVPSPPPDVGPPVPTPEPRTGLQRVTGPIRDFYQERISPSRPGLPEDAGLLRQYGPLAATGAGIMALAGGFRTPRQEQVQPFADRVPFGEIEPTFRFEMPSQFIAPAPQYTQTATARPPGFAAGGAPRMNGAIEGPGTGVSDSIPARLSDGEFVFTARAVRGAGNGSRQRGIEAMYEMMRNFERNA